ncbi:uncharacterized protein ADD1 [Plodia interpunctella]|uniref:uncharacterized protein ADD1 n=1 Tax=Plodia interpunctella TaxID=58824 RepID=UPI00236859A4|nr:uncharacterized protein LOC128669178 [Plodia interpunctella]
MGETANSEGSTNEPEKPVQSTDVFPPFPKPEDTDFDEDIIFEERNYYKNKFLDLKVVQSYRLHCTACDRHLGCSAKNENRMRAHPMLRTLVCHTCHTFYNSGEFDKGDDGSELYCRWCGQGGQVYCCSDCPHVFCAKCIKRNLGMSKIKEIENTDDWKCFKCNPKCLWDLRALCWALLRYCDLKNKITYAIQDPDLKEVYQKDCALDHSECCRNKGKRKSKDDSKKKIDEKKDTDIKKPTASSVITKIPPTIQVKKFASMIDDSIGKQEKKAQKRPCSPKPKQVKFQPVNIAPGPAKLMNPIPISPANKKMKIGNTNFISPVRYPTIEKKTAMATYGRSKPVNIRPMPILTNHFNGFSNVNSFYNDNINLSLDSLTQGLDMAAVTSLGNNGFPNDVVCTPDFPLEPLCEVTEDNTDDDVQCITPGPVATPKVNVNSNTPPPLVARTNQSILSDASDNIIQMTENDVTVNAATGGLKFRVDPQTLSSNKMYRLPDGRIFAINANPAMPGGYSATIVAVTENLPGKVASKGATYAAKLSAVTTQTTPPVSKTTRPRLLNQNRIRTPKSTKTKGSDAISNISITSRSYDGEVPVEWFRYNLLDAVDSLEYSLSKLHKLKKEATSMYLRTRTINEMKSIHKSMDRLLHTSSTRFNEIRQNLNKEMKQYLNQKKSVDSNASEDDDDDVEILNDGQDDDPIFIDENSVDSNINDTNSQETHDVDLTTVSSDHNDSVENINDKEYSKNEEKSTLEEKKDDNISETSHTVVENENCDEGNRNNDDKVTDCEETGNGELTSQETGKEDTVSTDDKSNSRDNEKEGLSNVREEEITGNDNNLEKNYADMEDKTKDGEPMDGEVNIDKETENSIGSVEVDQNKDEDVNDVEIKGDAKEKSSKEDDEEKQLLDGDRTEVDCVGKIQDTDMSDEMIDNLLSEETSKEEILGT